MLVAETVAAGVAEIAGIGGVGVGSNRVRSGINGANATARNARLETLALKVGINLDSSLAGSYLIAANRTIRCVD